MLKKLYTLSYSGNLWWWGEKLASKVKGNYNGDAGGHFLMPTQGLCDHTTSEIADLTATALSFESPLCD